ncbi:MAG: right-handed parallel beta-helix repeat-containing protein [Clostridia bacterium]|nr:right-handed parallel beta-helix repeat-containing protein [Clostridia bacterium]
MDKIYSVKTYDEFLNAAESAKKESGAVINIIKDIFFMQPIEIENCCDLKITSENACTLIGGIAGGKWKREGAFLTYETDAEPRILIVNGKVAKKTSYPCEGFLENTDITAHKWMNSRRGGWDSTPTEYELTHITAKPREIPSDFDIENCDIRVIHTWDESTVAVKSYDRDSGKIVCASNMAHPAGAFDVHKYQFLNTKYGLPQKGKWYYDRNAKKIYYCPLDGESENSVEFMIPTSRSLLRISHSKNIKISNLKFLLSNSDVGEIAGLRAINPCGAVQIQDSEKISLDMLEIGFSGGQGIKFLRTKNLSVTNCIIEKCAACGIVTFECEDEYIGNNVISDIGLNDFSAVSLHAGGKSELVYVMDGCREEHGQTVIEHNTIEGSPYCGIVCSGGPHIIQNNKVTGCMKMLSDGGAIYCSRAKGTQIKENYISDICSDAAYAFYLDELSENCIVDGNVSKNVYIPFASHIAKNCIISNNLVVNNGETMIRMSRSESFKWKNNLIVSKGDFTIDIKSYIPEEKYSVKKCIEFCNDVISAPNIKILPDEKINFNELGVSNDCPNFTEENGRFVFEKPLCGMRNKYIVERIEPHCVDTGIKPDKKV